MLLFRNESTFSILFERCDIARSPSWHLYWTKTKWCFRREAIFLVLIFFITLLRCSPYFFRDSFARFPIAAKYLLRYLAIISRLSCAEFLYKR